MKNILETYGMYNLMFRICEVIPSWHLHVQS